MEDRPSDRRSGGDGTRWLSRGLTRRGAKAYQGALEAVLILPAGAVVGYLLDHWLGTSPWLVLTGLVVGFVGFVVRLIQLPGRLAAIPDETAGPPDDETDRNPP